MKLHSKVEAADYIWQYSRFYHSCLVQCENLFREEKGFSCVMIMFNCLENIAKSVVNDYDSNLYNIFLHLYEKSIITKKEYEFLNEGDFCVRKTRNLYAHKNIAAINFLADFEGRELLWPLTENVTSLMIYSKISDIVFNLMIKIVSSGFIDSVREKFEAPLDEAIDECNIQYKILTSKELLALKGYPEDYIPDNIDVSEDMRVRLVDNAPDVNINMHLYDQIISEIQKGNTNDKKIIHDPIFLAGKSEVATKEDLQVAQDLLDTLIANKDGCVGMAANMIGVRKRIIVFDNDGTYMTIFNPEIIKKLGPYDTEESCLSLLGDPCPCKRFQSIKVQWQTAEFQTRIKTFTGWPAQIIQHEIDHCNGVLI